MRGLGKDRFAGMTDDNDNGGAGMVAGSRTVRAAAGGERMRGDVDSARRPRVRIITMGCAKNEADSDRMRASLESAGFRVDTSSLVGAGTISPDGGDALPDITIVNTCSFITGATQESIDAIFAVVNEREELSGGNPLGEGGSKVVVAGCIPSRYGDDLSAEIPEVDAFVSVDDEDRIVRIACDLLGLERGVDGDAEGVAGSCRPTPRTTGQPFAYVKISDGCDRFCSFCTIPYIRGRYESRPARQIADEVRFLVEGGTREIVLVGQDTGVWGDDLPDRAGYEPLEAPTLASLLEYLARSFPDTWFRVMYLQPERIGDDLLDVMAGYPNVCSYLDIPLQHASAKVISEMNRKGSGEEYLGLLQHVRERVPGVTLRTTVISGFPGETEDESDELVEFMEEAGFDFAGVFEYSREDGTVAGEREDQVPGDVAVMRANEVREAIGECGIASANSRVGGVYDVLVCGIADVDDEFDASSGHAWMGGADRTLGPSGAGGTADSADAAGCSNAPEADGLSIGAPAEGSAAVGALADGAPVVLWGRAQFQAPEVDSVFYFRGSPSLVGSFVRVEAVSTMGYDLEGELQ